MSVLIVDTACANLASVGFAFERLDIAYKFSSDAEQIKAADRVIIPGVGAARYAMDSLDASGLTQVLRGLTQPVMGICLGMQLLFERSDEGQSGLQCLGYIPGDIREMEPSDLPLPHMGWNQLSLQCDDPLLHGVSSGDHAYFVHSFAAPVSDYTLASCTYGAPFSAIVRKNNVWGCQFHPERSAQLGAQVLQNFSGVTL